MYKVCIFDLDGTLTDTIESIAYSVNLTLKELGLEQLTQEQCMAFAGNGARNLMELSLRAAGDEELKLIDKAMEVYGHVFKENCTYHAAPFAGIQSLLETLKEMGLQLSVLSNKPHLQTIDVVNSFFEDGTFAYIQGQREDVPRKPDPAGALLIAETLGASKEECLYIGDSDTDMLTGKAAGMTTVGVSWGFRTREVLQEHGADYIVDRPEDIVIIAKRG